MDLNVAGHEGLARQVAGVESPWRLQGRDHTNVIVILPHMMARADHQFAVPLDQTHRRREVAAQHIEDIAIGANHKQLAGLIGGDQKRDS